MWMSLHQDLCSLIQEPRTAKRFCGVARPSVSLRFNAQGTGGPSRLPESDQSRMGSAFCLASRFVDQSIPTERNLKLI